MNDFSRLSINQVTTRDQWSLRAAVEGYARHGIHGIGVWRDKLAECGVATGARLLADHGMRVSDYCVGGLLTTFDDGAFQARLDDTRRVIDEAAAIGARCVMFIAGGLAEGSKDLDRARARVLEGVDALVPHARAAGVTIALEPLHPMVCASRSVISTLAQANDWCDQLDAGPTVGIAVDVYAVWWDPRLAVEIARAGERIVAFHVNDWLAETRDLRLDRGMMGDGVIDVPRIRRWVEAAGYDGDVEVEIFSERNWWRRDPDEVVEVIKQRYLECV